MRKEEREEGDYRDIRRGSRRRDERVRKGEQGEENNHRGVGTKARGKR